MVESNLKDANLGHIGCIIVLGFVTIFSPIGQLKKAVLCGMINKNDPSRRCWLWQKTYWLPQW